MRDIRDAIRALRAAPGFTCVALIVLTLGIGASTAIYSVVDAVVLRGLPFDDANRIVALSETFDGKPGNGVAPQEFLDWKARQDVFESMAATRGPSEAFRLLDGDRNYQALRVTRASADLFAVLHVSPRLGRTFSRDNEIAGNERVAVLSDEFWHRQFGADPHIVGQMMRLTNGNWEIVGVMPPRFTYPVGTAPRDLWVPYAMTAEETLRGTVHFHNTYLQVVARTKPGVTVSQARARMEQVMSRLATQYPSWFTNVGVAVKTLKEAVVGTVIRSWLLMLLGTVACVLAIASVNVANLMLARATVRSREIGIRAALGATRWQIVQGLLVESLILALAGTALGVVVAYWGVEVLRTSLPSGIPRADLIAVNVRVLAVAALTAVATGVAFGLVPALQASRVNLVGTLREGGRSGTASPGRQRLRAALVIAEVSLAVVLLVGAGLFISSFARLMRIDVGLDYHQILAVGVYPRVDTSSKTQRPLDMARAAVALGEMVDRVRAIPGIQAASVFSGGLPLSQVWYALPVTLPGHAEPFNDLVDLHLTTPDYPTTLRVPLLRGRLFTDAENRADGTPVVVLNDVAAARYLGRHEVLGATIGINGGDRTVVGVVGGVRASGPETEVRPEAYIPIAQEGIRNAYLMIRTQEDPSHLRAPITSIVFGVAPDARIGEFQTLDGIFSQLVAQRRFNMLLLGLFGVVGIAIASIGIYGVVSHLVQQRTQEIGVRMALGAEPSRILQMVLSRSGLVIGAGVAIGLVAAWALSKVATGFLFQIQPHDPLVYVLVALLLGTVGLIAAFIPARRAAKVDPLVALRTE
jgi:predicted permease